MMTSQILKLVDFTKMQKPRYLENETLFLLKIKSSLIIHQGVLYGKKIYIYRLPTKNKSKKNPLTKFDLLKKWEKCIFLFFQLQLLHSLEKFNTGPNKQSVNNSCQFMTVRILLLTTLVVRICLNCLTLINYNMKGQIISWFYGFWNRFVWFWFDDIKSKTSLNTAGITILTTSS